MRAALKGNVRPSTDHIIKRLRDGDHNIRILAVELASKSGDPRTIEALCNLTRNDNVDIACAAIDALASIGAPALEFLETIIDSGSTHTANKAIAALGAVKSTRAVDFLLDRLRTPDFARKDKVIEVLGVIGDPRVIEEIEEYLTNESEMLRESAARSLGESRDARAVDGLRRLLVDPVGIVRLRAYPNTSRRHWHMACNLGVVVPRIARRCVDGRWISVKVSPDPRGLVGTDRSGDPDLQNQL